MASIGESVMRVSFTKKYIKIRALEIDAESEKAEVERIKMSGGNEFVMAQSRDRLNWISGELLKLADADENGDIIKTDPGQ